MGSYDQLTQVSMTITGPTGDEFTTESVVQVVRKFVRDDIDFTVDVRTAALIGRYEAVVNLWPKQAEETTSGH